MSRTKGWDSIQVMGGLEQIIPRHQSQVATQSNRPPDTAARRLRGGCHWASPAGSEPHGNGLGVYMAAGPPWEERCIEVSWKGALEVGGLPWVLGGHHGPAPTFSAMGGVQLLWVCSREGNTGTHTGHPGISIVWRQDETGLSANVPYSQTMPHAPMDGVPQL